MKPVGIVANLEKAGASRIARMLVRQLRHLRQRAVLEESLADELETRGGRPLRELARACRLLVVLGGDGTILKTAREIHPYAPPLLPVNLGKLGFLAAVPPSSLRRVLPLALSGRLMAVSHSTLEVAVARSRDAERGLVALNDVVISRGPVSRITELKLFVDGQFLNSYVCDGMIVSTPTGSTAYSLSAGGPIIVPEARVLTITPICPHTLSNRSVIISDRSTVEIQLTSQRMELLLGLDGQRMVRLAPSDRVSVRTGSFKVRIITPPGGTFFELLRKKLRWTGSHIS
jgi:NAD+ kinase